MLTDNQLLSIKTMNCGIKFILQVGVKNSNIIDYQIEMINQNAKDCLIDIEKAIVSDNNQLHYDITGLQSLGEYLSKNTLNKKLLIGILDNICEILLNWDSYFLNKNNYLLDMSYIFIDIKTGRIKMIYVPIEEQLDVDIDKRFKTLLKEIIVDYVILEDTALDDYLYKILNTTKDIDFSIKNFKSRAQDILNEKTEKKVNQKSEDKPVKTIVQVNHIDKQKNIEPQEYTTVYKPWVKFTCGIVNVFSILVIVLTFVLLPKFVYRSALIVGIINSCIIIADIIITILLFSNKNKIKVLVKTNNQNKSNNQVKTTNTINYNNTNSQQSSEQQSPPSVNLSKREIVTQLSYDTEVLESSIPYLLLNQGGTVDKIFINKDNFKLGRLHEINDYVVQSKAVGKEHAEIAQNGLDYSIKDLNSKNGTFLNGKKLNPNECVLLRDDDEIILANISFKFKLM